MKSVAVLLLITVAIAACGGGAVPTPSPTRTAGPTVAGATATPAGATPAGATAPEALCGLLTPEDWQQFNYVTGAEPDVTSDLPGAAVCQYASGLFLEVYTHATEDDAEETFQTILENVPIEDGQELTLPGADDVQFDPDIGDDHAGIVVRAGRLAFFITGLNRDSVQAELTTLAGLVLTRSSALQ